MSRLLDRVQRAEETRRALLRSARALFAASGYSAVTVEQVARAAEVTQGALYHHFRSKEELFAAVADEVGAELAAAVVDAMSLGEDGWARATLGLHAYLDLATRSDVQRILYVDGPSVGFQAWREGAWRHGGMFVQAALTDFLRGLDLGPAVIETLGAMLVGSLSEAAVMIATSPTPDATATEVRAVIDAIMDEVRDLMTQRSHKPNA